MLYKRHKVTHLAVKVRETPCDVYIIRQGSYYVGVLHNLLLLDRRSNLQTQRNIGIARMKI